MRLINSLFSNPSFIVERDSVGYIVRDIINMNWWNTSGNLLGYAKNKRLHGPFTEDQKRIAVQLKEFYRHRLLETRDTDKFKAELHNYIQGKVAVLRQLGAWSMPCRANPSQYFTRDGEMTWVDCTSRATYAAKYVFQNGYIDFDGVCRAEGMTKLINWIKDGTLCDLGVAHLFEDGENKVKAEIFSQKSEQTTVAEWVEKLGVSVLPERQWLFSAIGHVRTDPYKIFEAECVADGTAPGVNECLYGLKTMASVGGEIKNASDVSRASRASDVSRASGASGASSASSASDVSHASGASRASHASSASRASRASNVSHASDASYASDASHESRASDASRASMVSSASNVSDAIHASNVSAASRTSDASYASRASAASHVSRASDATEASHASGASRASHASSASNVSRASDAGFTTFTGSAWSECEKAVTKPGSLEYPKEFRKNIFAMAGHWKIDKDVVSLAKLGWFDPFMGHGSSPLYAARHGVRYLGFDTNARAFDEYLNAVKEACATASSDVDMRLQDSTEYLPELENSFDLCYTSPPYFNFEEYGGNTSHYDGCDTYEDFHQKISAPVLRNAHRYLTDDGILALQLSTNKIEIASWKRIAEACGFEALSEGKTGCEAIKYSKMSKRSQGLLIFRKALANRNQTLAPLARQPSKLRPG